MSTWDKVQSALAGHSLRHERGDMWRCNSPFRAGADGMAFTLNISDGEHGAWFDHAARAGDPEKGTLYELAKHLGIDLPQTGEAAESKRAYRDLAEYAALKGVPAQAFIDKWWKPETVTIKGRSAIEFPTQGGTRWRFIDGDSPHFISEPGYRRCWYALPHALNLAKATNTPLIFANGEPSVVVGQHFGLPVTTITSGEKSQYPPELIAQLKAAYSGEIVIALDCDYKGSTSALKLKEQLQAAGFKVKAVNLGLGDKGDIADFCKLHGKDALKSLATLPELEAVKTAQATKPVDPVFEYCSDLDALQTYISEINGEVTPQVPPLINPYTFLHEYGGLGHIIPAGKLLYFASISGGTKTIGFETGWEALQDRGIHSIVYSPEWIDDRGAIEMAARAVQRAGGTKVHDMMLNSLFQQEQIFKMKTNAGKALESLEISESIGKAVQLMKRPGRVFFIKKPGLPVEQLCAGIEAMCDREASNVCVIRAVWIDFAQLLWLENPESSGRLWIETAIGLIKDTCRRKNLVGFISSQMRKDDAASAGAGGKLDASMMQWLSDQQANFILAFVPEVNELGQRVVWVDPKDPEHKVGKLRGRIVKNSLAELPDKEFEIPVDFLRLSWMQKKGAA